MNTSSQQMNVSSHFGLYDKTKLVDRPGLMTQLAQNETASSTNPQASAHHRRNCVQIIKHIVIYHRQLVELDPTPEETLLKESHQLSTSKERLLHIEAIEVHQKQRQQQIDKLHNGAKDLNLDNKKNSGVSDLSSFANSVQIDTIYCQIVDDYCKRKQEQVASMKAQLLKDQESLLEQCKTMAPYMSEIMRYLERQISSHQQNFKELNAQNLPTEDIQVKLNKYTHNRHKIKQIFGIMKLNKDELKRHHQLQLRIAKIRDQNQQTKQYIAWKQQTKEALAAQEAEEMQKPKKQQSLPVLGKRYNCERETISSDLDDQIQTKRILLNSPRTNRFNMEQELCESPRNKAETCENETEFLKPYAKVPRTMSYCQSASQRTAFSKDNITSLASNVTTTSKQMTVFTQSEISHEQRSASKLSIQEFVQKSEPIGQTTFAEMMANIKSAKASLSREPQVIEISQLHGKDFRSIAKRVDQDNLEKFRVGSIFKNVISQVQNSGNLMKFESATDQIDYKQIISGYSEMSDDQEEEQPVSEGTLFKNFVVNLMQTLSQKKHYSVTKIFEQDQLYTEFQITHLNDHEKRSINLIVDYRIQQSFFKCMNIKNLASGESTDLNEFLNLTCESKSLPKDLIKRNNCFDIGYLESILEEIVFLTDIQVLVERLKPASV